MALIRKGDLLTISPETVLQPADEILAVAHSEDTSELARLQGDSR